MAERPLLAMPRPARRAPPAGRPPRESIPSAGAARQTERLGPKFERLERALGDPDVLGELRDDPSAIVPERALVFEVASEVANFYRAVRGVPGLEFLGEDEGDAAPDEDFFVPDKNGEPREHKRVPRRFYFTIPDQTALRELVSLWQRFQRGEELGRGRTAWRDVFGHLADVRAWGPRDRLTEEAIEDWQERLQTAPDTPIRFETEFWYRDNAARREAAEAAFTEELRDLGAELLDRSVIDAIRYHAVLSQVPPAVIGDLLEHPDIERVVDCAENRATLIGWNTIHSKETDRFTVPLPAELDGIAGFRALSVTIAWLTPVTHSHRMYRLAKFKVGPGGDKSFSIGVGNAKQQPSHNALGKGTVYHQRWEGEEAANFVDNGNLLLDVTCTPAAGELDDAITYAVVVTLEVGQDIPVRVYERVRAQLRAAVPVRP